MGGTCSTYGEMMDAYRFWMGKTEGKGPLGRPRCGWEDNVKMDIQEVGWSWTGLIWRRVGTGGGLL